MKNQAKQELKNIVIQALQQYMSKSGITKILAHLYKQSLLEETTQVKNIKRKPAVKKRPTVTNILQSNKKAVSKIRQLKDQSPTPNYMYDEEYEEKHSPILSVTQNDSNRIDPTVRGMLNQNVDSITNGQSILDANMPAFLKKGLLKAKKNGK